MTVAAEQYGHIPTAKGEDDGSVFSNFLTQRHLSVDRRSVKWEEVRDILGIYKVRNNIGALTCIHSSDGPYAIPSSFLFMSRLAASFI